MQAQCGFIHKEEPVITCWRPFLAHPVAIERQPWLPGLADWSNRVWAVDIHSRELAPTNVNVRCSNAHPLPWQDDPANVPMSKWRTRSLIRQAPFPAWLPMHSDRPLCLLLRATFRTIYKSFNTVSLVTMPPTIDGRFAHVQHFRHLPGRMASA